MQKNFKKNKIAIKLFVSFVFVVGGLMWGSTALAAGPAGINLGTAGDFALLAKTGISTTGGTSVFGNLGVSPAAASYITGFALDLSAGSAFATSFRVVGRVYAPGYADPTPANITTSVANMETAYNDGAGRTNPTATELGAGNIGGMTLAPGLYKWSTGVTIPTDLTLSGGPNDVWIFQIAQNLDISSATSIRLSGGAQAGNIFWIVAGQTTIGTTAVFNGNILDQTAIVLNTGASLNGRALAQTAVTLDSNIVTLPASVAMSIIPITPIASIINPVISTISTTNPSVNIFNASDSGCLSGNKFSVTTGKICLSFVPNNLNNSAPAAAFGQAVRTIAISLGQGGRGNNVRILQQFLISQNKGPSAQALARAGATSYFGLMTKRALAEFQAKVGIKPALGNFGPITRAYLRLHY